MAYTDIDKSDDYFNTILYTGTSATNSVTGVGFQPDFVWAKNRGFAESHILSDAVRGATLLMKANTAGAEATNTEGLTSFDTDGFSLGTSQEPNKSGYAYVAWNWLAANGTASNTDGSITSTVSANTTAGFSISTYTGNATSGATIGHGLGVAPDVIIVKNRDAADAWQVYHSGVASDPATDYLVLNTTAASVDNVNRWNDTAPTSSVFSLGNAVEVNTNTEDYVAYCFAGVEGFSKFGSYTGNGSADGPFVWCGSKPAFILFKNAGAVQSWCIFDVARQTYNVLGPLLLVQTDAETSVTYVDALSNGFKLRTTNARVNGSGVTHIFMAFAENPFGGDGVAPATAR